MAVILSPSDQATVQENQRSTDQLPEYYDALSKQDIQISRDFEAFLILTSDTLKTAALAWIQKATNLNKTNKFRDALTQIAIGQELANAQAQLAEYDLQLQHFTDFRTTFKAATEFAGVSEVQLFLSDLQRGIEELSIGRDRAFFDQTISEVLLNFEDQTQITEDQVQELQSWTTVISEYLS